jgi:hypothetical protein
MSPELAQSLAAELNAAPYGSTEKVLARWIERTGLSRSTLIRRAKAQGYTPQKRKRRKDAGIPRCGISDDGLLQMAALMKGSHRKTGSIEMPTTEALDICQRAGSIPVDASIFTVRRLLREKHMDRNTLQKSYTTDGQTVSAHHVRLKSEHPNHLHQVDVSACLHWYFKKGGGLGMLHKQLDLAGGKKAEPYKKIRNHILRYILVDHKSGAFNARYYYAQGETALNMIDFLFDSWRRREDPRDIFQGAPRMLYFDKGSANIAFKVTNLLDNLQVKWMAHQAGVARAKGLSEVYQRIWQQAFESRLWLDPPRDLDELNQRAADFRIHFCETRKQSKNRLTRWAAWSSIKGDQLRTLPPREIFNQLIHDKPHKTKAARDKLIRYKGDQHLIESPVDVGEKLEIIRNPYQLPEIMAFRVNQDGTRGEQLSTRFVADLDDIAVPVGQEWRRHADTPTQKAMKASDEVDLEPLKEAAFRGYVDELPQNVTHLERKGTEIQAARPQDAVTIPPTPRSNADAEKTGAAIGLIKPAENKQPVESDPLPRPAFFNDLEHRYRWTMKRIAAGLAVQPDDIAAAKDFEKSSAFRSSSPEFWERDAHDLRLAM